MNNTLKEQIESFEVEMNLIKSKLSENMVMSFYYYFFNHLNFISYYFFQEMEIVLKNEIQTITGQFNEKLVNQNKLINVCLFSYYAFTFQEEINTKDVEIDSLKQKLDEIETMIEELKNINMKLDDDLTNKKVNKIS